MNIIVIKSLFKQSIPRHSGDLRKKQLDLLIQVNIAVPLSPEYPSDSVRWMLEGQLQKEPMTWFFLTKAEFRCWILELCPDDTAIQTAGENLASDGHRDVSDCPCPAVDLSYMLVLSRSVKLSVMMGWCKWSAQSFIHSSRHILTAWRPLFIIDCYLRKQSALSLRLTLNASHLKSVPK